MKPVVIIPAFNPDEKLIDLVEKLTKMEFQIIAVNDGSGQEYWHIFDTIKAKYQCDLCNHSENMGKGAALKTGIQYADVNYPECSGYITADADGQHSPEDILSVANSLEMNPDGLVLGTRNFSKSGIPIKSFLGNRITSLVYFLSTGKKCRDTQTGLRGIPRKFTELSLSISGDKYEYEMNMLLIMGHMGITFIEVPIAAIYLEKNKSSHFNSVKDSIIIYLNIFKYSFSSFFSAGIDVSLFTVLVHFVFGSGHIGILEATVAARLVAGGVNFLLNKHWVFQSEKHNWEETFKYFTLFGFQILVSWLLVTSLKLLPVNITLIKIFVDFTLFFVSYQIQKVFVFK
ncbi:MAG: bifunctional glycosyltransferase family 2/GtrA family protein, partial [Peptostreptococcaceae bacterium]|nr:bifunctional glycosyltransferase family 2/GtrA family protein [Peptostreptococcaceae bacterium]